MKKLTIKEMVQLRGGKVRIIFQQRSVKPVEMSARSSKRFHVGDAVSMRGKGLVLLKC